MSRAGPGRVSPGLTVAGSPGGIKINFQGSLAKGNCTSAVTQPQGDQVTGGTFTGSGYYTGATASSCANFHRVDVVGQITVTITWVTTGTPIAPTTIVYKNNPRDRLRDTREHDHPDRRPARDRNEIRLVQRGNPAVDQADDRSANSRQPRLSYYRARYHVHDHRRAYQGLTGSQPPRTPRPRARHRPSAGGLALPSSATGTIHP